MYCDKYENQSGPLLALCACLSMVKGPYQKVVTYVEYRALSGVFQNIGLPKYWPPTPLSTQRVCPPPAPKAGEYTLAGQWVNILEDARHWIGLLQYNLSTGHTFEHIVCRARRRPSLLAPGEASGDSSLRVNTPGLFPIFPNKLTFSVRIRTNAAVPFCFMCWTSSREGVRKRFQKQWSEWVGGRHGS